MLRKIFRTLYMVGAASMGLWLLAALVVAVCYHIVWRDE